MGVTPIQTATLSRQYAHFSNKSHDIFTWKNRLFFLSEIGFLCSLGCPGSVDQADFGLTDCCLSLPS